MNRVSEKCETPLMHQHTCKSSARKGEKGAEKCSRKSWLRTFQIQWKHADTHIEGVEQTLSRINKKRFILKHHSLNVQSQKYREALESSKGNRTHHSKINSCLYIRNNGASQAVWQSIHSEKEKLSTKKPISSKAFFQKQRWSKDSLRWIKMERTDCWQSCLIRNTNRSSLSWKEVTSVSKLNLREKTELW